MRKQLPPLAAFAFAALLALAPPPAAAEGGDAADRAWVLDCLKRFSPDGWSIVDSYIKKDPANSDFMSYWEGASDEKRWDALNTIVHESAHGYMRAFADGDSIYYYISPRRSMLVPVGKVFRTQAMMPSIPEELRTFRFSYIDTDDPQLGSQVDGAYGLLDEMNAYWVGTQAAADMLPLFQARGASAPWIPYFNSVNGTLYGVLEFRYFVLRYILYAKEREPAVYRDIMANAAFRAAFAALDRRSRDFAADWLAGKPALYESIRKSGIKIEEKDDTLYIGTGSTTTGIGTFMDIYELLRLEMAKPEYSALISALYDGAKPASWPDSGAPPAARGGYEKGSKEGEEAAVSLPAGGAGGGHAAAAADPTGKVILSLGGADRRGDAKQPCADIVKAQAVVREDGAVFRMELASLPETLPFDLEALEPGAVEYEWSFDLDLDGDGKADYSIGLSAFKSEGGSPSTAPILDRCAAELWKIQDDSASSVNAPLKAAVEGSAIVLTLGGSEAFPMSLITARSFITAKTYYNGGSGTIADTMDL